jgi:FKBP-type peptidyl-prolyl cis-trans isomerase
MNKFSLLIWLLLLGSNLSSQTPQTITEHGYRFFHHINKGGQKPKRGESIKAYVNIFAGDTLLSSSRKNLGGLYKFDIAPADAHLDFYPPLMDAALIMGIGDSATIFQPVDTTMRKFLPNGAKNEKELRFEIALVQIVTLADKVAADKAFAARAAATKSKVEAVVKAYQTGTLNTPMEVSITGLKILVEEKGRGRPVREGEAVQVHYYGFIPNGTSFDNSFDRRSPLTFPAGVGQMIPGFDEGILKLNHGSKAYLFVPSSLAYGNEEAAGGLIPPNSELIFYLEVL